MVIAGGQDEAQYLGHHHRLWGQQTESKTIAIQPSTASNVLVLIDPWPERCCRSPARWSWAYWPRTQCRVAGAQSAPPTDSYCPTEQDLKSCIIKKVCSSNPRLCFRPHTLSYFVPEQRMCRQRSWPWCWGWRGSPPCPPAPSRRWTRGPEEQRRLWNVDFASLKKSNFFWFYLGWNNYAHVAEVDVHRAQILSVLGTALRGANKTGAY